MLSSIVISEAAAILLVVALAAFGVVTWVTESRVSKLERQAEANEWTVGRIAVQAERSMKQGESFVELFILRPPAAKQAPCNELTPFDSQHAAGDVHPFVADAVVSETEAVHGVAA